MPCCDIQRIRVVFDGADNVRLDELMTGNTNYFVTADKAAIIINKNATKENALLTLSDYFIISTENIIAFGDDKNDIGMLKAAGIGVAMENASDEIKTFADYITQTNDNEGVSQWINENLFK